MITQQYIEGVIVVGLNKEEQYHHLCTRFRVSSSSLLREVEQLRNVNKLVGFVTRARIHQ